MNHRRNHHFPTMAITPTSQVELKAWSAPCSPVCRISSAWTTPLGRLLVSHVNRVGRWGVWVAIFAGEVTWDTWDVAGVLSVCNYYMFVCFIV